MDANYLDPSADDDESKVIETRPAWRNLSYCGWSSAYLDAIECEELPKEPGIYVVAHEWEKPALYVGQSKNLRRRLTRKHHKIEPIVKHWEESMFGYHNHENVTMEIRIFWKVLPKPYYNGSVERTLIWFESMTIGLLCPIAQGNMSDIEKQNWAPGMNFY
ncbi:MAG: hypothetical protein KIH69_017665 [Anaerolineae bacterium]|nr:hypothetical protein [Anaerolineae bacterium]